MLFGSFGSYWVTRQSSNELPERLRLVSVPPLTYSPQNQRAPGVAMDASLQDETARQIGRRNAPLLSAKQARQDRNAAEAQRLLDVLRQAHQRRRENVGEDQIVRPLPPHLAVVQAEGVNEAGVGLIQFGVLVGDAHRRLVDVGPDRDLRSGFRRRNRQHAGAAADVQNPLEPFLLQQLVERYQTADSRAVVAGAEGRAGVDLQVHGVLRHDA